MELKPSFCTEFISIKMNNVNKIHSECPAAVPSCSFV